MRSRIMRSTKIAVSNEHWELTAGVCRLAFAENHVFLEGLHGIDVSVSLFLDQVDLAEGAATNHLDDLEIFNADILRAVVGVRLREGRVVRRDRPARVSVHIGGIGRSACHQGGIEFPRSAWVELFLDSHRSFSEAVLAGLSH